MSNAKQNLINMVKQAKEQGKRVNVGIGEASVEEMEELLALTDENGEIEIDGATVKIVKGDSIPEEILKEIKEDLSSTHPGEFAQMMKMAFISNILTCEKTQSDTEKIYQFLRENDIAFDALLAATTNLALAGFSDKTIGTAGIETDGHYLEYIQDVQTEMKITQSLLATNPVINSTDFVPIGLLLALTSIICDEDVIQELLFDHRFASFAHKERLDELTKQKFKLVGEAQELGQSAKASKEVDDKIKDLVKEKTGKSIEEIISMLGAEASESDVSEFLDQLKEQSQQAQNMETDTKAVC